MIEEQFPHVVDFFEFMLERESVRKAKEGNKIRPWTQDPVLSYYRFTNVFRERDYVTRVLRETLYTLRGTPELVFATIMYRQFNNAETGQKLFSEDLHLEWDSKRATDLLWAWRPKGPWVSPAYIIRSPQGLTKVEGCCQILDEFWEDREYLVHKISKFKTHEEVTELLSRYPCWGPFMGYEVACDLHHSGFGPYIDAMTWCNPGPGAKRGMNRVMGKPIDSSLSEMRAIQNIKEVLRLAKDQLEFEYPLEMREIEHSLCEYDKYIRASETEHNGLRVYR